MFNDIDKALITAYQNAGLGISTIYENVNYPDDGDVLEEEITAEFFILNIPAYSLNLIGSTVRCDGILRILLRAPANKGAVSFKDTSDTIFNVFSLSQTFSYGTAKVTIISQERQLLRNLPDDKIEKGWYKIMLSLNFIGVVDNS